MLSASLAIPGAALAQGDYPSLPPGPGRDVMVRVCSQCHSPEIVANQRMDHDGWKALVDQMANNGANATNQEFDTVTTYLATVFPATPAPATGAAAPAPGSASAGSGASAKTNDATGTVTP